MRKPLLTRKEDTLFLNLSPLRGMPEFTDALAKVKDIPGANFDWDTKLWKLPAEPDVAERVMHSMEATAEPEVIEWARSARQKITEELTTPIGREANLEIAWAFHRAAHQPRSISIGGEEYPFDGLMEHQRPVVEMAATKRKLIIADDMGLGKSGMVVSALEEYRLRNRSEMGELPNGPKLIIAPNSVKGSWARELKLWMGEDVVYTLVEGAVAKREQQIREAIQNNAWVIVNWEQVRITSEKRKLKNGGTKTVKVMKQPLFEKTPWLAVVADEVHRAKNRKSQQTQGLWRTRSDDGLMLALSGTPLMNSPDELWAILRWLWPKEYTSYWRFYEKYVDYYETYFGKIITGVKNPDALRFELKDRLVRRTQGQVLDLPGKGRVRVPIELHPKQAKLYKEAEKALWLEVEKAVEEGDKGAEKFAALAASGAPASELLRMQNGASRLVRLRQIIETPATLGGTDDSGVLDACVDHVLDSRPEQWVVFCEFQITCDVLVERLRKQKLTAEVYNGSIDPKVRTELEDRFQKGEIDVLVGTIDAMYQGITLTAGSRQFWVSRDWTPAKNEQGEDRQNRIGQTKRVQVFIAQPNNTVATDKVEPTNRLKERIVKTVLAKDHIEERTA